MNQAAYKELLVKAQNINQKMMEIFKIPAFRKELVNLITLVLNRRANLPNYVVVLGNDFECSIKYSKGSLMQIIIGNFNVTLYEVPRIAINSL